MGRSQDEYSVICWVTLEEKAKLNYLARKKATTVANITKSLLRNLLAVAEENSLFDEMNLVEEIANIERKAKKWKEKQE